ncbi:hypothetical protein JM83_2219 [Gillisia sp. Hel_I_86]|nr:hypothetical protein JM83_2219 [Gillisia sp. Hel_I_86]
MWLMEQRFESLLLFEYYDEFSQLNSCHLEIMESEEDYSYY